MPMAEPAQCGTCADGSPSAEYCCFCYQGGHFTAELTLEQMTEKLVGFAAQQVFRPNLAALDGLPHGPDGRRVLRGVAAVDLLPTDGLEVLLDDCLELPRRRWDVRLDHGKPPESDRPRNTRKDAKKKRRAESLTTD
jgi:hypothetical protein